MSEAEAPVQQDTHRQKECIVGISVGNFCSSLLVEVSKQQFDQNCLIGKNLVLLLQIGIWSYFHSVTDSSKLTTFVPDFKYGNTVFSGGTALSCFIFKGIANRTIFLNCTLTSRDVVYQSKAFY